MSDQSRQVSLVITTYNHARFLAEAIESILVQTVPPSEIIVVDDGSTDDPAGVVNCYEGVIYVRQENQGLAAARNTGLELASGRFVAFLDADDKLHPNAIAANLNQFQNHPECAFVYGAYDSINGSGKYLQSVPLRPADKDAFRGFLTGNLIGMHATVLYRRECLANVGGFNQSLPACEDYHVYLELSRLYPVTCTAECLADYRRHDNNMSNNVPLMLRTSLEVLSHFEDAARSRPEWITAYHEGVRTWKKFYSEMQVVQLVRSVRAGSLLFRQLRNTIAVARIAPGNIVGAVITILARSLRKRTSSKHIDFGDLKRTAPFSNEFGFDRGKPVDRRYIEAFLSAFSTDIRGRVLEIGDNEYTRRFGGPRVVQSDVLSRYENPASTFVGDLASGEGLPSETFDCIVLTQTLHLLFDLRSSVATLWRILRPGGVLLVTVPWVSPIDRGEWGPSWYWSLSPVVLSRLLSDQFGPSHVEISHYGNVYSAAAFLYGLAEHELNAADLDVHDPYCPVIVASRARKRQN
jgi:glycosyltransferase involved in cell wall biosynthesis